MVRRRSRNGDGVVVGLGCMYIIAVIAFWIAVVVVAVHFIHKFW